MGGLFSGIVMPPAGKVNALEGPGTDRKKLAGAMGRRPVQPAEKIFSTG